MSDPFGDKCDLDKWKAFHVEIAKLHVENDRLRAISAELTAALELSLSREREWATVRGASDCACIFLSRDAEREYETSHCPHQIARAALAKAKE